MFKCSIFTTYILKKLVLTREIQTYPNQELITITSSNDLDNIVDGKYTTLEVLDYDSPIMYSFKFNVKILKFNPSISTLTKLSINSRSPDTVKNLKKLCYVHQ